MACLILVHLAHSILFVFTLCLTWHPLPHHNLSIVRRSRSADVIHTYIHIQDTENSSIVSSCMRTLLCSSMPLPMYLFSISSLLFENELQVYPLENARGKFPNLERTQCGVWRLFPWVRALYSELRRALFLLFHFQLSQDPHFLERLHCALRKG